MELELYKYTPLTSPSRTIRALDILPSNDIPSQISIELQEVSLDTPQLDFRALSYVWGDATDTTSIDIEGKALHVTRNCDAALRSLRRADKGIRLWIDAICIDQSSIMERSRQVALMGEIYTKAEGIFAFLGQTTLEKPLSPLAWKLLQDLASFEADESQNESEKFNSFYRSVVSPRRVWWEKCCQDLKPIFQHPWWERLWIYQEIMLARQTTMIFGLGETLDWDVVKKATKTIYTFTAQLKLWLQKDYVTYDEDNIEMWRALIGCGFIHAHARACDKAKYLREQESAEKLGVLKGKMPNIEKDWRDELWQAGVWKQGCSSFLPAMLL